MRKFFTPINTICTAIGVFVVGSIIYVNVTNIHFGFDPETVEEPVAEVRDNPLLTAAKNDVAGWFPGTCFAEIYMQNPSYNGGLVKGCIDKTAQEIKAQTGAALSAEDFRSPEVISHFKTVYGAGNPWRS